MEILNLIKDLIMSVAASYFNISFMNDYIEWLDLIIFKEKELMFDINEYKRAGNDIDRDFKLRIINRLLKENITHANFNLFSQKIEFEYYKVQNDFKDLKKARLTIIKMIINKQLDNNKIDYIKTNLVDIMSDYSQSLLVFNQFKNIQRMGLIK